MKTSIAIPTYEYAGYGVECLEHSFEKMENQTFKEFDVVISDSSVTNDIKNLCTKWENRLDIKYYRNKEAKGNPAKNFNNALLKAEGEWIKLLCQDDYLYAEDALGVTFQDIPEETNWIATGYLHTYDREGYEKYHYPYLNPRIFVVNTIGTPSCVTIKNTGGDILFDDNLYYCWDCEFYYRYFMKYGTPHIEPSSTIINYLWDKSISSKIQTETIERENRYILEKHGFLKNVRDNRKKLRILS